ncbi:hypothetical protein C0989_007014 [Termitomyces sp. Mn162]|nr:hypothetical protein C0989_007014 [Termitomyces sp. Mn162]
MSASDAPSGAQRPLITSQPLLAAEYVDESHLQSFENALGADEFSYENQDFLSPKIPGTPVSPALAPPIRIHRVSALSDFAPVNMKAQKKGQVARQTE